MTTASTIQPNDLLERKDAARFLGLSPNTLTCWVTRKKGPPFFKPGKKALYKVADLQKFLDDHRVSFEQVPL
jgi:hypothetical protein